MWFAKSSKDVFKRAECFLEKTGLSTEEVKSGWKNMDLIELKGNAQKKFAAVIFGTASGYAYLCAIGAAVINIIALRKDGIADVIILAVVLINAVVGVGVRNLRRKRH